MPLLECAMPPPEYPMISILFDGIFDELCGLFWINEQRPEACFFPGPEKPAIRNALIPFSTGVGDDDLIQIIVTDDSDKVAFGEDLEAEIQKNHDRMPLLDLGFQEG